MLRVSQFGVPGRELALKGNVGILGQQWLERKEHNKALDWQDKGTHLKLLVGSRGNNEVAFSAVKQPPSSLGGLGSRLAMPLRRVFEGSKHLMLLTDASASASPTLVIFLGCQY